MYAVEIERRVRLVARAGSRAVRRKDDDEAVERRVAGAAVVELDELRGVRPGVSASTSLIITLVATGSTPCERERDVRRHLRRRLRREDLRPVGGDEELLSRTASSRWVERDRGAGRAGDADCDRAAAAH